MQVGSVEVATTDDASMVRTPGTQVVVDSESTTQVGVDRSKSTSVMAEKGSASVASSTGGAAIKLNGGQKVNATAQGSLSPVRNLLMPPALLAPADNQVYPVSSESRVDFGWDAITNATSYVLQVSRSRLFTSLEINSRRQKTTASAKVTAEGAFYWRVAAIGPEGRSRSHRVHQRRGGGRRIERPLQEAGQLQQGRPELRRGQSGQRRRETNDTIRNRAGRRIIAST